MTTQPMQPKQLTGVGTESPFLPNAPIHHATATSTAIIVAQATQPQTPQPQASSIPLEGISILVLFVGGPLLNMWLGDKRSNYLNKAFPGLVSKLLDEISRYSFSTIENASKPKGIYIHYAKALKLKEYADKKSKLPEFYAGLETRDNLNTAIEIYAQCAIYGTNNITYQIQKLLNKLTINGTNQGEVDKAQMQLLVLLAGELVEITKPPKGN